MNFKLLFIVSLALGTVFLDAIRLVEHGNDEISLLDKLEWALFVEFNIEVSQYSYFMILVYYTKTVDSIEGARWMARLLC